MCATKTGGLRVAPASKQRLMAGLDSWIQAKNVEVTGYNAPAWKTDYPGAITPLLDASLLHWWTSPGICVQLKKKKKQTNLEFAS